MAGDPTNTQYCMDLELMVGLFNHVLMGQQEVGNYPYTESNCEQHHADRRFILENIYGSIHFLLHDFPDPTVFWLYGDHYRLKCPAELAGFSRHSSMHSPGLLPPIHTCDMAAIAL